MAGRPPPLARQGEWAGFVGKTKLEDTPMYSLLSIDEKRLPDALELDIPEGDALEYKCVDMLGMEGCFKRLIAGVPYVRVKADGGRCQHIECYMKNSGIDLVVKEPKGNKRADIGAFAPLVGVVLEALLDDARTEKTLQRIARKAITGLVPTRLVVENHEKSTAITVDSAHEKLPRLIAYLSRRKHTYLYGPSGSGKSTGTTMAAQALGLRHAYISLTPQTPEYRVFGYNDANGKYIQTDLYDFYKNGGVFCIDEMDNASASMLVSLNTLLQNGHGAFPCGMVERHKDFVLVACGNTNGLGANRLYPERRRMDAAARGRLRFIEWGYDEKLELMVATGINKSAAPALTLWAKSVRAYLEDNNIPDILLSPREVYDIADELAHGEKLSNILEETVWKGADKETVRKILAVHPLPK